jgi:hypothetical protein
MKKYFLLLIIAYCSASFAQNTNINESLDKYFVGIPVRESFENWTHFILTNPHLGVDSFNSRGVYSSFKPGIKSRFPFRDSMTVKILFQKTIYYDSLTNKTTDSVNEISIEGVFPDSKRGKKESIEIFKDLKKDLRAYYRHEKQYFENERVLWFSEGKNKNFPDCILQQGYSEELRFYFVMITYSSRVKNIRH